MQGQSQIHGILIVIGFGHDFKVGSYIRPRIIGQLTDIWITYPQQCTPRRPFFETTLHHFHSHLDFFLDGATNYWIESVCSHCRVLLHYHRYHFLLSKKKKMVMTMITEETNIFDDFDVDFEFIVMEKVVVSKG